MIQNLAGLRLLSFQQTSRARVAGTPPAPARMQPDQFVRSTPAGASAPNRADAELAEVRETLQGIVRVLNQLPAQQLEALYQHYHLDDNQEVKAACAELGMPEPKDVYGLMRVVNDLKPDQVNRLINRFKLKDNKDLKTIQRMLDGKEPNDSQERQASPTRSAAAPVAPAAPAVKPAAPAAHMSVGPVPLEGYDHDKLYNMEHKTQKYLFGRVASHYPLTEVKDKASGEALLKRMRPDMEAAGLQILDIQGDKIKVVTDIGVEWVDVIRGSGSGNPGWWWGSEGKPVSAEPAPAPASPAPAPAPSPAPAPAPAGPPPAPTGDLTPEERAIAEWAGIEPSRHSYTYLMDEMAAIFDQNAIGPGVNQPKYVSELQGWLKHFGYDVDQNGQFDAKTTAAVLKFKRDEGKPFSGFRFPDGSVGVHPFIDEATKAVILDKYAKELGPDAGHYDELGIFRPTEQMKAALGQAHSWVWDQSMRDTDASAANFQRIKEEKQATGLFKLATRHDGVIVAVPKLTR